MGNDHPHKFYSYVLLHLFIVFVLSQTGCKIQRAHFAVVPTTVVLLKRLIEMTNLKSDGLKSNDLHICDLNVFPIQA